MKYEIDVLNAMLGSGVYTYNVDALNALCLSYGLTGGHIYDIDAYNEIVLSAGGTESYYVIDALNKLVAIAGGTVTYVYNIDALNWLLTTIGGLVEQNFDKVFPMKFDKLYLGWDNDSYPDNTVKNLQITFKIQNESNGITYKFEKNSDSYYRISSINKSVLEERLLSRKGTYTPLIDGDPAGSGQSFIFHGTGLKINVYKNTDRGIIGAVVYDGNFIGKCDTGASSQYYVRTFKKEDDYYYVYDAGNYSSISAGFSSLAAGDLIHYKNGIWNRILAENVIYSEVDCYLSSNPNFYLIDIITGLASGTHRCGVFATNKKNTLSSGVNIFLKYAAASELNFYAAATINPTEFNAPLIGVNLAGGGVQWEMSTKVKKNGTAQTDQWIPAHSGINTLIWDVGENIRLFKNGVEITTYLNKSVLMTEITTFRALNVAYAINTASPSEKLMKVTSELIFDVNKLDIKQVYECLIPTYSAIGYSFMLPYSLYFNKFISDKKERVTIPANGNTANITDGCNRVDMMVFNDTVGGDYEDYMLTMKIKNLASTNLGSSSQCYMSTFDPTFGKIYFTAMNNKVWEVGEIWETTFEMRVGKVDELISKAESYAP